MNNSDRIALLSLICCLLLGSYALIASRHLADPATTDFYKFYKSARFLAEGKSIYTPVQSTLPSALREDAAGQRDGATVLLHPNMNSPLHTLTVLPFSLLPVGPAYWAWTIFSVSAGIVAIFLIVGHLIPEQSRLASFLGLFAVFMAYFPSLVNVVLGQYGFIVMLCAVLLWLDARNGRSLRAGIVLGLASSVKIFFGFLFSLRLVVNGD
jgi:hypothetical protein